MDRFNLNGSCKCLRIESSSCKQCSACDVCEYYVAPATSNAFLVVPPGYHYWGGQVRSNAEFRRTWA